MRGIGRAGKQEHSRGRFALGALSDSREARFLTTFGMTTVGLVLDVSPLWHCHSEKCSDTVLCRQPCPWQTVSWSDTTRAGQGYRARNLSAPSVPSVASVNPGLGANCTLTMRILAPLLPRTASPFPCRPALLPSPGAKPALSLPKGGRGRGITRRPGGYHTCCTNLFAS